MGGVGRKVGKVEGKRVRQLEDRLKQAGRRIDGWGS